MDLREIVTLAALTALLAVVCLGLWALALKFQKPELRTAGIKLGIFGGFAIGLLAWVMIDAASGPAPFVNRIPGPARGSGSVTREIDYYASEMQESLDVELRLEPYPEEPPSGVLTLRYRVLDPSGKELLQQERQLSPASATEWQPATFTIPAVPGVHKFIVEIPQGADMLGITVKTAN